MDLIRKAQEGIAAFGRMLRDACKLDRPSTMFFSKARVEFSVRRVQDSPVTTVASKIIYF